jgi:hypothetical protein
MFNKFVAKITAWLASKGGFSHVVAAAYLAAVTLYASVPAFANLLNTIYGLVPAWGHELLLAVLGVAAWYRNGKTAVK